GINCEDSVLLMDSRTGGKGRFTQTQYRFALHKVDPFPYDVHLAGKSAWLEFLASVEEHLCLIEYRPGWLVQLERYLYLRTEGGIRSEEHTSELQSREKLVCRLMLEKTK